MRLVDTQAWEREYDINKHHDIDWVKHTMYSYIRLYESEGLNTVQKEQWYDKHIWLPIDTIFDDIKNIHIVVDESVSLASTHLKNKNRMIGSTSSIKRVKYGYKCDMIVIKKKANHEYANEFGTGEAEIKFNGTKHVVEGGIKIPKSLKDMRDKLISNNKGSYEGLAIFGLQHSGLNVALIIADRPKKYITE